MNNEFEQDELEKDEIEDSEKSQGKMVKGSAWMTIGSILSRILGAIYIIPWRLIFGASLFPLANTLYTMGYNIYSEFLTIAIAGIPSAVAEEVAHYNALNEYGVSAKLYKKGITLSIVTGVVCALLIYFCAPILAGSGGKNAIPVIRSLAWAILIIPAMSLTRGYFQGFQQMAPSAMSQFVEQLGRVIYMLASAFFIMVIIHGSWVTAVTQSTFAAFVGAIFGFLALGWYYWRRRDHFQGLIASSDNAINVKTNDLYKEIISQAVPFIILGSGITIFQLIDQYSFFNIMHWATNYTNTNLQYIYAIFASNANKLIMIVVSLASALAITVVPLLSEARTKGDNHSISKQLSNALILFEFVMFPAALGMAAIAGPINRTFYGTANMDLGADVLTFSAIVSISLGLFTVVTALMQGISENKRAVKYFVVGTVIKLVTQVPLVYFFGAFGALMATTVGFTIANYLIIHSLRREFGLEMDDIKTNSVKILTFALITYLVALIVVYGANFGLGLIFNYNSSLISLFVSILATAAGGFVYLFLVLRSRAADRVLGNKMKSVRGLLHIR
ncbi:polysaccharide biosynthesis protein [Fructilactobacillus fructivorans]|uniref:putative polysaccharide biosynthesis protein n=1 Tax=Fructilactobacillus fructivorans TaxID=1614 RepID=UPI000713106D|nr:polysaccharide biosynthesis protein [Fructilactobacillus fructivorans]KRN39705.1 polysaccharide biosynthesis protein [Fructilactobacillus fructivorans]